ncbi:MAG: penicillin acylase family protein [Gemmataceae bacterium]|nr:penicillin acylase family protein [Gemmataceae bacterium]
MRSLFCFALLLALLFPLQAAWPSAGESAEALLKKARAVLAQLEGEITLAGLKEPVEVLRDRWGVPHIYAKNAADLFFAQGFVAAQDRLFQLDLWRRVATGETAEVIGKEGLEADRFARLIRYRGAMDAEWASYSPDTKQILTAFTRGINACIDHVGKRLPIEFQLLGIQPKKWQPEDCLGRMSGIVMSSNFRAELARARLIGALGIEGARRLAPTDPPLAYALAPGIASGELDPGVLAGYRSAVRTLTFPLRPTESNNWVIDGTLSASGKPMLAGDPHRALAVPALRYLVHLNAPGWHVIGSGEPALPGVALGHNDHIAWAITIVTTDQTDIYVEETHPLDPTQYRVGQRWERMKLVREPVRVKGEAEPVELKLFFTSHGPVIHQDVKRRRAYALKWAGSEPGGAAYLGSLAVGRARDKQTFLEAVKSWKIPALNIVYADKNDTIGWVAAGLTPVRKGWDGLLPVPGAEDRYKWAGYLPVEDLPQTFNPKSHLVATANHNILPPGYKHSISHEFAPPYRFQLVKARLEAKKPLTLQDFQSIQHEETSLPGQALARLAGAVDMQDPRLEPYAKLLAGWDGVLSKGSAAGALYAIWLQELQDAFYRPRLPEELLEDGRSLSGLPVMLAALEKASPAWFGESARYERDRLVRTTFTRAVERAKSLLGPDAKQWRWGKLHTATFRHALAGLGPAHAQAFNLGPVERGGDAQTPNNTRHDEQFRQVHGATYRQVFDLADWDRGLATSVPGQSGQPGSPHYGDLLPLWAEGRYFPLAFSRTKVEEVTRHRLRLAPAAK